MGYAGEPVTVDAGEPAIRLSRRRVYDRTRARRPACSVASCRQPDTELTPATALARYRLTTI